MARALKAAADQLAELNAEYGATDSQFMSAYQDYQSKRKAAQARFKDSVFLLRKEVSARGMERDREVTVTCATED